jgi:6-phosphofructokinase
MVMTFLRKLSRPMSPDIFVCRVQGASHHSWSCQRGGDPGAFDRLLARRLGAAATDLLLSGRHGILVGLIKGEIAATPLAEVAGKKKGLDLNLLELAKVLAG